MSYERQIAELPDTHDWDSYGAKATTDAAKQTARQVSVVPTSDGGIQLEWHRHGADVEIEIGPDGHFTMVSWGPALTHQEQDG